MYIKIQKYLLIICALACVILPHYVNGEMRPVKSLRWTAGIEPVKVEVITSANNITLNYQVPNATITTIEEDITCLSYDYTPVKVAVGNAKLKENEGKPILPVITARLVIPAGKEIDNINVTRSGEIEYEGEFFLMFGQSEFSPGSQIEEAECDSSIYNSSNPYPEAAYDLVNIGNKHGVSIAYINLCPISYIPQSGEIKSYTSITLVVNLKNATTPPCSEIVCRPERIDANLMGIENQDALLSYYDLDCPPPPDRSVPPGYCNSGESYNYLIITNQLLYDIVDTGENNDLHDLIYWRETKCSLTVKVGIKEDIIANYPGRDPQEQIRNYIIDAYNKWGIEYVLIYGNAEHMPVRCFYSGYTSPDPEFYHDIPSDLYYQCLDGDFNADGDGLWGEFTDNPDFHPEVSIGRAMVRFVGEVPFFIEKTIRYETESQTAGYFPEALFAAEFLGGSITGTEEMDTLRYGKKDPPTLGFQAPPVAEIPVENTLYDESQVWSREDMINIINSNKYEIINHLGHSNSATNMRVDYNDVLNLIIHNTNLLFHYTQGCCVGDLRTDCMGKRFTISTQYCMFAGIYNSNLGIGSTSHDGPSQKLHRYFWDAYFRKGIFRLGPLNIDSHEETADFINGDNAMLMAYYETNLLGDPYTGIWLPLEYNMEEIYLCDLNNLGKNVYNAHSKLTVYNPNKLIHFADGLAHCKDVTLKAGQEIILKGEVKIDNGVEFKAVIDPDLSWPK